MAFPLCYLSRNSGRERRRIESQVEGERKKVARKVVKPWLERRRSSFKLDSAEGTCYKQIDAVDREQQWRPSWKIGLTPYRPLCSPWSDPEADLQNLVSLRSVRAIWAVMSFSTKSRRERPGHFAFNSTHTSDANLVSRQLLHHRAGLKLLVQKVEKEEISSIHTLVRVYSFGLDILLNRKKRR